MNGTVDQQFLPLTECYFEYGIGSFTARAPCVHRHNAPGDIGVTDTVTGLRPLQAYQFQLVGHREVPAPVAVQQRDVSGVARQDRKVIVRVVRE